MSSPIKHIPKISKKGEERCFWKLKIIKNNSLTEAEKQNISALSQLAAGLAAASMGGDVGDIGTSIAASKNAVENNAIVLAYPVVASAVETCFATGPCTAITLGILTAIGYEVIDENINNNQTNKVQEDSSPVDDKKIIFIPDDMPKLEGYPIPELTPPFPGYAPIDPDKLGPNHTGHDGGLDDIDIRHDTGGNQIPDKDWRDYAINAEITRGEHAEIRNKQGRPVGQVINDIENSRPSDILVQDDGRWVVLGPNGRVHIIEPDGEVVTSYKNPRNNTTKRIKDGRWGRPSSEKLQEFRGKFSNYFKGWIMDLLKQEYVANAVTLFDLRLSESEITIYLDCVNFMLEYCTNEQINQHTEFMDKEELSWVRDDLLALIKSIEHKDFIPDRYK
jgi:hypothetical protein